MVPMRSFILRNRCEWKGSFCFPRSTPLGFDGGVYLGSVARLPVEFICFDASDWSEELSALTSWPRSWTERLALRSPPPEPRRSNAVPRTLRPPAPRQRRTGHDY